MEMPRNQRYLRSKTKSFVLSLGDCLSSNFGIRVQGPLRLPSFAHGLVYSMCRSFGRSWLVGKGSCCLVGQDTNRKPHSLLHYSILTHNETADPTHDQIPLCTVYLWQSQVQSAEWTLIYRMRLVMKSQFSAVFIRTYIGFSGFPCTIK